MSDAWKGARLKLMRAIRSFERADIEYRRAQEALTQPRLSKAGTRYLTTKLALFRLRRELLP